MEKNKKSFWDNKFWILFLIVLAVFYIAMANNLGFVGIQEQVLFLLTQIAFVLIPGMALVRLLCPAAGKVEWVILSYLAGIGILIAQYYIVYAVGLKDSLLVCMTVVSACGMLCLYLKRDKAKKAVIDNVSAWAVSLFTAGVLLLVLFIAIPVYNTPDVTGSAAFMYQDMLWNAGNVTSISNGLPVMDLHIDGFTFGYHFFASIYLAVFKNILGVSAYLLNFKLFAAAQVFVYVGGLYLLFTQLFKNKWAAAGAAGVAVFSSAMILQHMFWYAYATPMGIGLALAAVYCFIQFMKKMPDVKLTNGYFILFLVLLAVTTGTKAPYAGGVLAGAGVVLLVQLFRRKNVKTMLAAGLLTLAVFGAVYVLLVYDTHAFNGLSTAFASIMWMSPPPYYMAALEAFATLAPGVVKLMTYPLYMALNYPLVVASIVLLVVAMIRQKKMHFKLKLFLLSAITLCFLVTTFTYQPGMSNLFFMEGTMPLCVFALLLVTADFARDMGVKKGGKIAVCCITAFVLIFAAVNTVNGVRTSGEWLRARDGVHAPAPPYDSITPMEYEGMLWLRDNTESDAIFASDRQHYTDQEVLDYGRYYYYTAFAERQCYIEGYNYVSTHEINFEEIITARLGIMKQAYTNDAAAIGRLVEEGVDYLVASRLPHPSFVLDERFGEAVFENEGITIYKLY